MKRKIILVYSWLLGIISIVAFSAFNWFHHSSTQIGGGNGSLHKVTLTFNTGNPPPYNNSFFQNNYPNLVSAYLYSPHWNYISGWVQHTLQNYDTQGHAYTMNGQQDVTGQSFCLDWNNFLSYLNPIEEDAIDVQMYTSVASTVRWRFFSQCHRPSQVFATICEGATTGVKGKGAPDNGHCGDYIWWEATRELAANDYPISPYDGNAQMYFSFRNIEVGKCVDLQARQYGCDNADFFRPLAP
jgi:hypothetical protein